MYSKRIKKNLDIRIYYENYCHLFIYCSCQLKSKTNQSCFKEIGDILKKKYTKWPIEVVRGGLLYRGMRSYNPEKFAQDFYKLPRLLRKMITEVENMMIFHEKYKSFGMLLKEYQDDDLDIIAPVVSTTKQVMIQ